MAAFALLVTGAAVKGILGIGLPMVAIPGLALLVGLPKAMAIVALPVAAANLVQVWQFRSARWDPWILWPFLAAGGTGVALGTWVLTEVPERLLEAGLAGILVVYIALRVMAPALALRPRGARIGASPAGLAAGLLHGLTGISGPVGILFFHAQHPDRPRFILATGAMFFTFTAVQLPVLGVKGLLGDGALTAGLVGLPAVVLGLWVGNRVARHVSQAAFGRLVLAVLGWTALALFWRAWTGGG